MFDKNALCTFQAAVAVTIGGVMAAEWSVYQKVPE